jgi:hypothetical protein
MKPVSMCWAMSLMVAICVTPGFSSFRRPVALSHPAMLAQDDGPVAVPGSADAPGSNGSDDDDDQSGQAANGEQTPDDDSSQQQQPPTNMQQPPADDDGDTSAQQQSGDSGDQDSTPAPSSGDDQN